MTFALRRASEADIPFIIETERGPGFESVVGRWEHEAHRAEMNNPASAYFLGEADGRPVGFVILQGLDEPYGNVLVKRIVAREPGGGIGRALLQGVTEWAFARPETHRVWLHVITHNERARRLYRSFGFVEEGVLREIIVTPAGQRASLVTMSMLRDEWAARAAGQDSSTQ